MIRKEILENSDRNNVSRSYDDGILKITGVKHDVPLEIPIEVIQERKEFWNNLFHKYMEKSSDETELRILNIQINAPIRKASSFVQYWVDTGRIPHKIPMEMNNEPELCVKDETFNSQEHFLKPSSSSSVDTAVYILSNMNTTNKENTLAIVEGSRQNISLDVKDTKLQNEEMSKHFNNEISRAGSIDIVQCKSETNTEAPSSIYSRETEKLIIRGKDITLDRNATTRAQQTSCVNLNRTVSTTLDYSKIFSDKLMHLISNKISNNGIRYTESEHSKETFLMENNCTLQDISSKLSQRKKLYSGRDSPVDLVRMSSLSKNRLTLTKFSHPALESGCRVRKRYKIYNKRRKKLMDLFRHSCSKGSLTSKNTLMESKRSGSVDANSTLIKCSNRNVNKSMDTITSNDSILNNSMNDTVKLKKPTTTVRKLRSTVVDPSSQTPKSTISNCQESSEEISPQDLNPVVHLKQLSEFQIWKYNKSNEVVIDLKRLNPVICLERLPDTYIQKCKNSSEAPKNLKNSKSNDFKQVSTINAKGHTEVNSTPTITCKLNPTLRLKRLSDTDIPVKTNLNEPCIKTRKSLETIRTQGNDLRPIQHLRNDITTQLNKSKTINLSEDTDSNHSTLLIYQCENNIPRSFSANNLTDINDAKLHKKLKIVKKDVSKNDTSHAFNDNVDTFKKKSVRKARKVSNIKKIKSNRNGYSLRVNKNNRTNNINSLYPKKNMDTVSNISVDSRRDITDALRSKKVKPFYTNSHTSPDQNNDNKKKHQSSDSLLSNKETEFVDLIPQNINKSVDNSIHTDLCNISFTSNKVNKRVPKMHESSGERNGFSDLIPRNTNKTLNDSIDMDSSNISVIGNNAKKCIVETPSSLYSQPNVNRTFRKPTLRTPRKKISLRSTLYDTRRTRSTLFQNKEKNSSVDNSKGQTVIENQMKVCTRNASNRTKWTLNESNLSQQSKLLDSDSEISFASSKKKNSLQRTTIHETRRTRSTIFRNKEKKPSADTSKTQTVVENQMGMYTRNASNKRTKRKLNENSLYFQTRLLDSDSEISVY